VLSHANPTSPPSSSPTSASSSPTPASSSVTVVHLWPKVTTPSRSSRRFLSILPFPCTFGGRPHRISISFPLRVLLQSTEVQSTCAAAAPDSGQLLPLSFAPHPSLGRPHRQRAEGLELLCASVLNRMEVEEDKVVLQLGPYTFL
jgi:hypothetical protein